MEGFYRAESLWRTFWELMEGGSYSSGFFETYCHSLGNQMLLRVISVFPV